MRVLIWIAVGALLACSASGIRSVEKGFDGINYVEMIQVKELSSSPDTTLISYTTEDEADEEVEDNENPTYTEFTQSIFTGKT